MPAEATSDSPKTELGHAAREFAVPGWNSLVGDTTEVPALQYPRSVAVYHRMRNDSQIGALYRAVTLPIRRRRWVVDPNGARDEVVELIAADLDLPVKGADGKPPRRTRDRFNHDSHLRLALLQLIYGHMFFETVGRVDDDLAWRLRKLAPRMPQSIQAINVAPDGGLISIEQDGAHVAGTASRALGNKVTIPVNRLVAHVWEQEGADWTGRSLLREVYREWTLKDEFLRIQAAKNRRWGMGVAVVNAPQGARDAELAKHGELARQARGTEQGGAALAAGAALNVVGPGTSLPPILEDIRYLDEAMARAFLAMFLQLGQTQTGSRALGESFASFFELALDAIAGHYAETMSSHVIEDMVDWNWGIDENAPRLAWEDDQSNELGVSDLVALIEAGAVTVDDQLEADIRRRSGLPEADPGTARTAPVQVDAKRGKKRVNEKPTKVTQASSQTARREGDVLRRQPFEHEVRAATDFEEMQRVWQDATDLAVEEWQEVRAAQIDALVDAAESAVRAGNPQALAQLSAPVLGADLIEAHAMIVVEEAVNAARAEALAQGATIPLVDVEDLRPAIRARAEATATLMARSISDSAARQAIQRYGIDSIADVMAEGLRSHLEVLSDAYLLDELGGALTQAQNTGRRAVFARGPVARYYASEILDANTCSPCAQKDGEEYDNLPDAEADYPTGGHKECDGGPRCRGTLVAVYESEVQD